jgi:hypothetical protein
MATKKTPSSTVDIGTVRILPNAILHYNQSTRVLRLHAKKTLEGLPTIEKAGQVWELPKRVVSRNKSLE